MPRRSRMADAVRGLFGLARLAVLLVGVALFNRRTVPGYETRMTGLNSRFSRYGGVPVDRQVVWVMIASATVYFALRERSPTLGRIAVVGAWVGLLVGVAATWGLYRVLRVAEIGLVVRTAAGVFEVGELLAAIERLNHHQRGRRVRAPGAGLQRLAGGDVHQMSTATAGLEGCRVVLRAGAPGRLWIHRRHHGDQGEVATGGPGPAARRRLTTAAARGSGRSGRGGRAR